jgi:diadenosine tetraphosphatase ApaH/serine/threonine PP2A family protein phosphatase
MIYAVISDIHGNLQALEAVRAEIAKLAPDRVFCLGDVVGYGASPGECIEVARDLAPVTVAGNHDFGVTGQTDITYFNRYAREAIAWTADVLDAGAIEYLRELPLVHVEGERIRLVHSTPGDPGKWNYIFTHQQAQNEFRSFGESICLVGHSHQPCMFEMMDSETIVMSAERVSLREDRRYIINVGSVGQPRDGDPRASFCILDLDDSEATIRRVEYDVDGAKRRIEEAGLPQVLANRLSWGE